MANDPLTSWRAWLNDADAMRAVCACTGLCYRLHWSNAPNAPEYAVEAMRRWLAGDRFAGIAPSRQYGFQDEVYRNVVDAIHLLNQRNTQLVPSALRLLQQAAHQVNANLDELTRMALHAEQAVQTTMLAYLDALANMPLPAAAFQFNQQLQAACRAAHADALTLASDGARQSAAPRRR